MATNATQLAKGTSPGLPLTWTNWHEAVGVLTRPRHLRKTVTLALVIGSIFFTMNQLGLLLDGHASVAVWAKGVLTYLTPFGVSNYSILVATRARVQRSH